MDHELENFEDSLIMIRNLPAVLSLDIAIFVASILVNVLGESAHIATACLSSTTSCLAVLYPPSGDTELQPKTFCESEATSGHAQSKCG